MQQEWTFRQHSDQRLLDDLRATYRDELSNAVKVIRILEEVDRRQLYAKLGYSSLFGFCLGELNMSEHEACLRMTVARTSRKFPVIIGMIARGELHLSGAAKLAPHLSHENHRSLLEAAVHKTKREIEEMVAARFPKPDVPESIRRLPQPMAADAAPLLPLAVQQPHETTASIPPPAAPSAPATPPPPSVPIRATVSMPEPRRAVVQPISAERYAIRFTATKRCRDLLERAKALMSHRAPNADASEVIEEALAAYVERLEKQKFKTTDRPRASKAAKAPKRAERKTGRRPIQAHVKREVYLRDRGQCTYVGPEGRRCSACSFLEYDHIIPVFRGGESTVENLRLRCRTHNGFTARQELGDEYVDLMAKGFRPVPRQRAEKLGPERAAALDAEQVTPPSSADSKAEARPPRPSSDRGRQLDLQPRRFAHIGEHGMGTIR